MPRGRRGSPRVVPRGPDGESPGQVEKPGSAAGETERCRESHDPAKGVRAQSNLDRSSLPALYAAGQRSLQRPGNWAGTDDRLARRKYAVTTRPTRAKA